MELLWTGTELFLSLLLSLLHDKRADSTPTV
jgi:hypothetical protein